MYYHENTMVMSLIRLMKGRFPKCYFKTIIIDCKNDHIVRIQSEIAFVFRQSEKRHVQWKNVLFSQLTVRLRYARLTNRGWIIQSVGLLTHRLMVTPGGHQVQSSYRTDRSFHRVADGPAVLCGIVKRLHWCKADEIQSPLFFSRVLPWNIKPIALWVVFARGTPQHLHDWGS